MNHRLQPGRQRLLSSTRKRVTPAGGRTRRARNFGRLTTIIMGMALFAFSTAPRAEYKGEFIPFPQVTFHTNDRDVAALDQHGSEAAVDFFYTAEFNDTRLLAEFYVDHEEREMERLAAGWALSNDTRLWLGRYHTALDQWNRKHHHGAYLQTTIYRPGIIEFEDDGGAIPAHATGLSLQSNRNSAENIDLYTLDIGLGPELTPDGLEALDILKPSEGEHALFATAAFSRQLMSRPFDDSGLFLSYVIIPSSAAGIEEVKLDILGAYSNYSSGAWHLRGSLMRIGTEVETSAGGTDRQAFLYAYLQPEYTLHTKWLLYGRVETTHDADDNLYLAQLPAYIRHRGLIGVRHQLNRVQALKVEVASQDQFGQRYSQVSLQWSAALP